MKPDAGGGSAPFFRNNLERIETPDKLTLVLHFKNRVWEVASNFTQFVGYQNVVPKKYLESVGGEGRPASHWHRPLSPRRRTPGRLSPLRGGSGPLAQDARLQGAGDSAGARSGHAAVRAPGGRDRHRDRLRRLPRSGRQGRASLARRSQFRVLLGGARRPDDAGSRGLLPDLSVGGRHERSEEPGERPEGPPRDEPRRQ